MNERRGLRREGKVLGTSREYVIGGRLRLRGSSSSSRRRLVCVFSWVCVRALARVRLDPREKPVWRRVYASHLDEETQGASLVAARAAVEGGDGGGDSKHLPGSKTAVIRVALSQQNCRIC